MSIKENLNPVDEAILTAIALLLPEHVSEWREIHCLEDTAPNAIDWRTLPQWSPEARECVAVALHDYAIAGGDASDVLHEITMSDRRVGVWLACAVARTVLHHVPAGEDRPLRAIECTERWVQGLATEKECGDTADAAYAAYESHFASYYAARAQVAIVAPPSDAYFASYYAARAAVESNTAYYAANVAYYAANDVHAADRADALRAICQTVASSVRAALDAL